MNRKIEIEPKQWNKMIWSINMVHIWVASVKPMFQNKVLLKQIDSLSDQEHKSTHVSLVTKSK